MVKPFIQVYDLTAQPISIGDIISFQFACSVIKQAIGECSGVFCISYDPNTPHSDPNFQSMIEKNGYQHYALFLSQALQFNKDFESFAIINSVSSLEFIVNKLGPGHLWPTPQQLVDKTYLNYEVHKYIAGAWKRNGDIPRPTVPPFLEQWGKKFIEKHKLSDPVITVNFRNNPRFHHSRNANGDVWLEVFNQYKGRATFFIICDAHEVDPRFFSLPNVVVVKSFGTTLAQDLALTIMSDFHMGSDSGISTLTLLNSKPFFITNYTGVEQGYINTYEDALKLCSDGYVRWAWNTKLQRMSPRHETVEEVLVALEEMMVAGSSQVRYSPVEGRFD